MFNRVESAELGIKSISQRDFGVQGSGKEMDGVIRRLFASVDGNLGVVGVHKFLARPKVR